MRNPNPISPRKQLQAFYAAQGLTRQEARKPVAHDMRRIREEFSSNARCVIAEHGFSEAWELCSYCGIAGLIIFRFTKEGAEYWAPRSRMLGGL